MAFKHYDVVRAASPSDLAERLTQKLKEGWQPFGSPVAITPYTLMQAIAAECMKKLLVTVKPFQGTIPFRILQRGRVLVEGSFSGKCTQLHSRTFQVNATNEELTVECTMNAAKCRMVSAALQPVC